MSSADITYWPSTWIPKSRGNAFDLSLPGLIDWSEFRRAKQAQDGAATLRRNKALAAKQSGREQVLAKQPAMTKARA